MFPIAISYRSEDECAAKVICRQLAIRLGIDSVFMAKCSVRSGRLWAPEIERSFKMAEIVVAVIGEYWAVAHDGSSRLGPSDYVTQELDVANNGRCRSFVPILLGDTSVPNNEQLAAGGEGVQALFRHQAIHLDVNLNTEVKLVCERLVADVIGVFATYSGFPVARVSDALWSADTRFFAWHNWSDYFEFFLKGSLQRFIQEVWFGLGPRSCKILLAHPESVYAEERAVSIRKANLKELLDKTTRDLEDLVEGIVGCSVEEVIEVRLCMSYPSMPLYIVDDRAFVGWYPPSKTSHESPSVEIRGENNKLLSELVDVFSIAWATSEWFWDFGSREPRKITGFEGGDTSVAAM